MEILHNIMLIISTPVIGLLLIGITNRTLHRLTGSEIDYDGVTGLLTGVCLGWTFFKLLGWY